MRGFHWKERMCNKRYSYILAQGQTALGQAVEFDPLWGLQMTQAPLAGESSWQHSFIVGLKKYGGEWSWAIGLQC